MNRLAEGKSAEDDDDEKEEEESKAGAAAKEGDSDDIDEMYDSRINLAEQVLAEI